MKPRKFVKTVLVCVVLFWLVVVLPYVFVGVRTNIEVCTRCLAPVEHKQYLLMWIVEPEGIISESYLATTRPCRTVGQEFLGLDDRRCDHGRCRLYRMYTGPICGLLGEMRATGGPSRPPVLGLLRSEDEGGFIMRFLEEQQQQDPDFKATLRRYMIGLKDRSQCVDARWERSFIEAWLAYKEQIISRASASSR